MLTVYIKRGTFVCSLSELCVWFSCLKICYISLLFSSRCWLCLKWWSETADFSQSSAIAACWCNVYFNIKLFVSMLAELFTHTHVLLWCLLCLFHLSLLTLCQHTHTDLQVKHGCHHFISWLPISLSLSLPDIFLDQHLCHSGIMTCHYVTLALWHVMPWFYVFFLLHLFSALSVYFHVWHVTPVCISRCYKFKTWTQATKCQVFKPYHI